MAFTTQGTLLTILRNRKDYEIPFAELDIELHDAKVLGFGVDVETLVGHMRREGYLNFDSKTEMVSLTQDYQDRIAQQSFDFK